MNAATSVGAILGVALLVPVLGRPTGTDALLAGHKRGWWLIAIAAMIAALVASRQPGKSPPRP